MTEQLVLVITSFIANTMSAFAGGGAGLLQFPVLIFMGLPFAMALATHKIATVMLGLGASLRYLKERALFDWKFLIYVMLCGIPGVILGANIILDVPEHTAKMSLGVLTIALGVYSIFKKDLGHIAQPSNRHKHGYVIGGLVLLFIGFLNGSLASGTGLFVTLWLILWFGLDYKAAVAYTLTLVGVFWNGAGAVTLTLLGEVKWDWIPALLIGSFLGGYAGAHLAVLKGSKWIKRGFEAVTILSGILLVAKA